MTWLTPQTSHFNSSSSENVYSRRLGTFLGQICSESIFLGSLHSNLPYLKFPQVWTNQSLSELKWERKHDRAGFNPVKSQVLAPCVNSASSSSGMSRFFPIKDLAWITHLSLTYMKNRYFGSCRLVKSFEPPFFALFLLQR
jgi:hypothetical protein